MKNFHIFVIKLKNHIIPIIFLIFTICLVLFSSSNLSAAQSGLTLFANSVVPSLFPFFVATELLSKTDVPYILGRIFNRFMKPIFNIQGEGSFAFIMGIISGYPTGAKIACNFRVNHVLSKVECERLLSFTNNSGPLFIIGTVGISLFGSSTIGLLLFSTHILACLTVGFLFRFWKSYSKVKESNTRYFYKDKNIDIITKNKSFNVSSSERFSRVSFFNYRNYKRSSSNSNEITFSNLGSTIAESITSAFSTLVMIGGFVVLFSVIISILNASQSIIMASNFITPLFNLLHIPSELIAGLLTGLFEITNGISLIADTYIKQISYNIIFTAFLLGFGGISVFLQVLSIVSKTDLSIKPYVIGKLLHGIFAAFYTSLAIQCFPIFNLNL